MKSFRNVVGALSELAGLVPVLVAYAALVYFHPQIGLAPLRYLAFAVAFIILPSYACSKLLPQRDLGVAERVCLGFPISQALLFLLAWGGSRLGLSWWGALGLPALGLYALWEIVRTRSQAQRSEPFFLIAVTAITTISLALCFRYFLITTQPGEGVPVFIFGDDAYMIMGTFSAIKAMLSGLPFMEGSFGDIPFAYHTMMQANNGVAHLVTGIHPFQLQLYLYPVFHWALLVGAVVAGGRRFAGFDRKQTLIGACLLLYASGVSFEASPWIQTFSFFHTYFYSLPGSILLGMLLFGVLSERLPQFPGVYTALLFFSVSSAKGVLLVLLPLSLLPVLAYRLYHRKLGRDDLKFSVGVLLSALVLRLIEYTSSGQVQLKKLNVLNTSIEVFSNAMEFVPFVLLVIIIAMQNRLVMHKVMKSKQYIILIAAMFVISIALTRVIDFVGGRQYFFWYFRTFLFIITASCIGYAFDLRKKALSAGVVFVLLCTVSIFLYSSSKLIHSNSAETTFSLSQNESDGLFWAYNNLDHSARIISNGAYGLKVQHGIWAPFGPLDYLVLSGLYGYAWLNDWMPPDTRKVVDARLVAVKDFWMASSTEERQSRLAAIPVEYLFVRKREDRGLDYTGLAGVRRIYSNEDLDIYALRNTAPQN